MQLRWILGVLLAVPALSRSTSAEVLIGNGPGSPYMGLANAIGVAHDGDVVLVRVAVNESITVTKGIAIVADVPGRLTWQGFLHVSNVPAGSTLLVNGFNFGLVSSTPLVISQNDGAIRIQDCGVFPTSVPMQPAVVGVVCTTNSDVAFLRCGLRGGQGPGSPFPPSNGARALTATDTTLTIQDSDVAGGNGMGGTFDFGSGASTPGTGGGGAIVMSGGTLVLQTSNVHGGAGGNGFIGNCFGANPTAGGPGGKGLLLTASAVARAIGGRTLGGVGGLGGSNPCGQAANGAGGVDVDASDGMWLRLEGVGRAFTAPRIVHVGDPLTLTLAGAPGERAFLAGGSAAGHFDSWVFDGVLLLQPDFRRVEYGIVDDLGALNLTLTTPVLLDGMTNDLMHLQPVFVDAFGQAHVGCAEIVVRIDAN
jgi:hypothetical protein